MSHDAIDIREELLKWKRYEATSTANKPGATVSELISSCLGASEGSRLHRKAESLSRARSAALHVIVLSLMLCVEIACIMFSVFSVLKHRVS